MQARPEKARGIRPRRRSNRALEGVTGTTAVHICFGYAAIIHQRPSGYSFLPELGDCRVPADLDRDRAVQSRLRGARRTCRARRSCSACSISRRHEVETPETVAARIRRALALRRTPEDIIVAPDCGMKYLPRDVAFGKMKAMVAGARIVRRGAGGGVGESPRSRPRWSGLRGGLNKKFPERSEFAANSAFCEKILAEPAFDLRSLRQNPQAGDAGNLPRAGNAQAIFWQAQGSSTRSKSPAAGPHGAAIGLLEQELEQTSEMD